MSYRRAGLRARSGRRGSYAAQEILADLSDTPEPRVPGADRLVCVFANRGDKALVCRPELRFETAFVPNHYVSPGIGYNGNGWGRVLEPKGLLAEPKGEPGEFDDRLVAWPEACCWNAAEYLRERNAE